jgi:cell division protein FtsZ
MQFKYNKEASNHSNHTKIKIIGVGGAGGNAINNMIRSEIYGVEFLVANTDVKDLNKSQAPTKINLGAKLTKGLGAGGNPEKGRLAAEESINDIETALQDTNMLFIAAGMGGGTGTGAAPVIARKAREMGILTLGIVTLPFDFDGQIKRENAALGINELLEFVDTLIVIPNTKITKIYGKLFFKDAFKKADEIITNATHAIADIITIAGDMCLDFADVESATKDMGFAMMGIGISEGDDRALKATENAISNPLLSDIELTGCKALLINITVGNDFMMDEFEQINESITSKTGLTCKIKSGVVIDENMSGSIKVTIIATGLSPSEAVKALPNGMVTTRYIVDEVKPNATTTPFVQTKLDINPQDKVRERHTDDVSTPKPVFTPQARVTELNTNAKIYKPEEIKASEPPAFLKKYFN